MSKPTYNPPVTIQVYLGAGKIGERIRDNIKKKAGRGSISSLVLDLLKVADPTLFKGVSDGK